MDEHPDAPLGRLELSDGTYFDGFLYGSCSPAAGEVVFQTGMVGYNESLTDPSYHSQLLVLTYPSIGNYGVPSMSDLDRFGLPTWFESKTIYARALIVSELCQGYSHFAATKSLHSWLSDNGVTCLSHIDTRELTLKLRQHGTMLGRIYRLPELSPPPWFDPAMHNLVAHVSCHEEAVFNPEGDVRVGILDCGTKFNQIRCFCQRGARVTLLPWSTDISKRTSDFDALFISNGPGDPAQCPFIVDTIRVWMATGKPLFGICLGHQLVARAIGLDTYKMKYGNRGHNQPCVHLDTQRCFITSQNHGYAVSTSALPDGWYELFRNANDHSNEGLAHRHKPWMTVQFHPEHMAGPCDMELLFDVFMEHVRSPSMATLSDRITGAIAYQQLPSEQMLTCRNNRLKKVLILGSGGLSIGQAGEFDYSGSQALKALREEGIQTLLVNPNVATVQTTEGMADKIFLLPVTPDCVKQVIESERPDGVLISFGGQTGLTCGLALANPLPDAPSAKCKGDSGEHEAPQTVLELNKCRILGTSAATIEITEDRAKFAEAMHAIGEKVAPAAAATTVKDAVEVASRLGYPVLIRAAFALGGMGSGFAENAEELERLAARALSQTTQVFIDKSLKGWKEVEYEVVRDAYNNCITVCNMENVDPVGIHTGESVVVAPSQTLSNVEYNMLRSVAIKVACSLHIVGECNIQFALDPHSLTYYIIEVNARLSRSSALASKATGYPLAYIAAKLCIGRSLLELTNVVTADQTTACFEPSLDYCVVKVPRWDLSKFTRVSRTIGSSMKSVGEVMAISRCFEESMQKALRMSKPSIPGFDGVGHTASAELLAEPTDQRMGVLAAAFKEGWSVDHIHALTNIDRWFLNRFDAIVKCQHALESLPDGVLAKLNRLLDDPTSETAPDQDMSFVYQSIYLLARAKRLGFSDQQLAHALHSSALVVRQLREQLHMGPVVRKIDTVAGEWPATTNYLYLTYADLPLAQLLHQQRQCTSADSLIQLARTCLNPQEKHDVHFTPQTQIMVLGSGVYRIGSSVEFDWCAVGCVRELRRLGWSSIMLNCNPETVSTDFDMCDRLYFDELTLERVLDVFKLEKAVGVILSMGGQTPNNIAMSMHRLGVPILGTTAESIDNAENRFKFSRLLDCMGISQPRWRELTDLSSANAFCQEVGYPCLVRPSYVLSGAAMNVAYDDQDLATCLAAAKAISPDHPVVISQFILDAKEIDVDAVAQAGRTVAIAVSEHVENAGVHSGDATLVTPPQDLNAETLDRIKQLVHNLADELQISGPFNLQLLAKDNRLQMIEANLRVSRSFPFVSKTLKYDFVAAATRCILGAARDSIYPPITGKQPKAERTSVSHGFLEPAVEVTDGVPGVVGVKVPVFSFSRLLGADVLLGVEMVSTGEVACLGRDRYEAYLLAQSAALFNTNGRLPRPKENIFLSIGSYRHKEELLPSMRQLARLGYNLYGSVGTADYYQTQGISVIPIEWPYEESDAARSMVHGTAESSPCGRTVQQYLAEKQFALIVSLTMRKTGSRRPSAFVTRGYMTRRLAVETNVPLITDVKVLKLLAEALFRHYCREGVQDNELLFSLMPVRQRSRTSGELRFLPIQCIASSQILYLPGLVDIHVHTRDPGQEHKEDWSSATLAALAGGIVTIFAMPNTNPAVVDEITYSVAADRAASRAYCDYALFAGATAENFGSVGQLARRVIGLKMYLNDTFTTLSLAEKMDVWQKHFENWPPSRPICCHAEGQTMAAVLLLAELTDRAVHICHVSRKCEIELIRKAKSRGLKVTCEVCPHHLFLTENDLPKLAGWSEVRPRLGTKEDVDALWANLDVIDCFATDHAPHLPSEKVSSRPPPGFPGLETMLPLLLTAMYEGRLTLVDLVDRLYVNPRRIFHLSDPGITAAESLDRCTMEDTWVEVDMSVQWCLPGAFASDNGLEQKPAETCPSPTLFTRANWSPFAGRRVRGKVRRVMLRGELAFVDNKVLVKPGFGINVADHAMLPKTKIAEPVPLDVTEQAVVLGPCSPSPRLRLESWGERIPDEGIIVGAVEKGSPTSLEYMSSVQTNLVYPGVWIDGVSGCHVLSAIDFSKSALHRIFNLAHSFRQAVLKNKSLDHVCRGKVMASLFFEPSTRTANSFTVAMQRLGGSVVNFTERESSLVKGETLSDTLRILAAYSDCLVIRHPGKGAIQAAAGVVSKPIINAGDGVGEHPTQALLDVFTIREEIGTVNGLTVTMVGDLAHGRTVHSLARLLCLYNVRLRYVTHNPELAMPEDVKQYVASHGIQQEEMPSLTEALPDTDVVYMTRVQAERIQSSNSMATGQFVITPELMTLAKSGMIVMHPLPRVGEICPSFDSDPRAAYFRQAEYGVYVRMALLTTLLAQQKQQ